MMVIEMREAAQQKAMDLIDEAYDLYDESKKIEHQKKMVLCELEDTLYDCFENVKDGDEEKDEKSEEGTDLGFKSKYNRHYAMRNFDDEDGMSIHEYRRNRAMRMRRNRMGRFA